MFKDEYKKAYDEIMAKEDSVDKILEQTKCKNTPNQLKIAWKTAITTILLVIILITGVNIPAFAQEIERITSILDTGAIDYTYYKSLQREHPGWVKNSFIPENASISKDGIIMKVELATFHEKKFEAIISFANEDGFNWIRKDGDYSYKNISVKIGDIIPNFRSMEFMKYDEEKEKIYYLYTANRHTAQIPESETVCIEIHGLFESRSWEESIDLSNVVSNTNTRVVKLYNSYVDETLIVLENSEYPYMASVLNMTPLSEIKIDQTAVTGIAYDDGVLRVQICQPDTGVYNKNYQLAYIYCPLERAEQLIWYEKIDGQLMLFMEDYYEISEDSLNNLPMAIKNNEKNGCPNTTWEVTFEVK